MGRPWPPSRQQTAGFFRAARNQVGAQRRELQQIDLGSAAAQTLPFGQKRDDPVDGHGIVTAPERREPPGRFGNQTTRWIASGPPQFLDRLDPGLQRRLVTDGGIGQRRMPIGDRDARPGKFRPREVGDRRPTVWIGGMPRQFTAPKKRGGIVQLLLRGAAMIG